MRGRADLVAAAAGVAAALLLTCAPPPDEARPELESVSLPGDLEQQDVPVRRQFEAARQLIAALESDDGASAASRAGAYGALAMLHHTYGYYDLALPAYRNATLLDPQAAKWRHYLAHAHLRRGDADAGIAAWRRVLELEPGHRPAHLALADTLADAGEWEEAESRFAALADGDPQDAAALLGLGRARVERGELGEAIALLERALSRRPASAPILYALGMAYRDAGQRERARALLARVPPENLFQETTVIEDPWLDALHRLRTGGRVHEVRGIRHLEARRFAAAVVDFRQAMAADPGRTYSLYGLGVALDALGRDAEAEEAFRGLLAGSPLHAPTHLALAQLLAELGRPDEARAHLRHCLEIDPDSSRARLELAHLDRAAGRFTSALQGYQEAARLDPARPEIRFWESVTLFLHGDSAGAVESSRRALADSGDNRLRALLARQLAATGGSDDRDEAEALARQAWRELPGASTAETVAFVLARRGRWSDAREWQEGVVAAGLEAPWMAERLAAYRRRQPPGAPWQRLEEWSDVLVAPPRDARSGG